LITTVFGWEIALDTKIRLPFICTSLSGQLTWGYVLFGSSKVRTGETNLI
jgi:hypothetical protein